MHRDRGSATGEGPFEDRPEFVGAGGRIVDAAAHFERDGHMLRHRITHPRHDLQRRLRHAQQIAPPAAAEHFPHRAAEVDVDHIEAGLHQSAGRRGEVVGIRSHQLPPHRMLVRSDGDPGEIALVGADHCHEGVDQNFAEAVGSPMPAGQHPHRPVAIARQRCLHHRRGEPDRANQRAGVAAASQRCSSWWHTRGRPGREVRHGGWLLERDHLRTGQVSNQVRP